MQARRSLEIDLHRALAMRELKLVYQPQSSLSPKRIIGFEALLRWQSSKRGLVSPADFIPLAKEIGIIVPIGEWVIRTACWEAAGWPQPLNIAVNVSARQFESPQLVPTIRSALSAIVSDLYRLVYHSRNLIPDLPTRKFAEVDKILDASRRNNLKSGVSDALIFNAGTFARVLEGARRDIESTFERIQRDERHSDVEILAFESLRVRGFPSWSMAYLGRSRENERLFAHIGNESGFEAKRLEGERIFSIMRQIAVDEEVRIA